MILCHNSLELNRKYKLRLQHIPTKLISNKNDIKQYFYCLSIK